MPISDTDHEASHLEDSGEGILAEEKLGGSAGPCTTASSSLSAPKLVMNFFTVFTGVRDRERDLDREDEPCLKNK